MRKSAIVAPLLALGAVSLHAADSKPPPEVYIDKGGCPFECCTYRDWTVDKETVLHAAPDAQSGTVGTIKPHDAVRGVTGEVHAKPTHFTVRRAHEGYQPGAVLTVFTTSGEGFYGVWRNGRVESLALGLSPDGDTGGETCTKSSDWCWGTFDHPLQIDWWVKIKRADGLIGWSNEADHFGNKDSCG
jgi:hypothetical protein